MKTICIKENIDTKAINITEFKKQITIEHNRILFKLLNGLDDDAHTLKKLFDDMLKLVFEDENDLSTIMTYINSTPDIAIELLEETNEHFDKLLIVVFASLAIPYSNQLINFIDNQLNDYIKPSTLH